MKTKKTMDDSYSSSIEQGIVILNLKNSPTCFISKVATDWNKFKKIKCSKNFSFQKIEIVWTTIRRQFCGWFGGEQVLNS